jgi:peroxiredoxin
VLSEDCRPHMFTIVIFYRGMHSPPCLRHIQEVEQNYQLFLESGFKVVAASMDNREHAEKFESDVAASLNKTKLDVPILYNLTGEQARHDWSLYMSEKRPGSYQPDVFSEPGMFVIRPDNTIFMIQIQSCPFTRPSMAQLFDGLSFAADRNYPPRGTYKGSLDSKNLAASVIASELAAKSPTSVSPVGSYSPTSALEVEASLISRQLGGQAFPSR